MPKVRTNNTLNSIEKASTNFSRGSKVGYPRRPSPLTSTVVSVVRKQFLGKTQVSPAQVKCAKCGSKIQQSGQSETKETFSNTQSVSSLKNQRRSSLHRQNTVSGENKFYEEAGEEAL